MVIEYNGKNDSEDSDDSDDSEGPDRYKPHCDGAW